MPLINNFLLGYRPVTKQDRSSMEREYVQYKVSV